MTKGTSSGPAAGATIAAMPVLLAATLGTALAYMSDDMLNLAIPSVARDLGATVTDVQWVLDGYYVTLVSFVLIAGSVGDVVGHRRVFSVGLVLFSLGAVACALAPGVPALVAGRAVQGAAAAMVLTGGLALVARLTPAADRTRAIALFLGLVAAVPAAGPFLSGALVDALSWRWLFIVPLVLPLGALAITRTWVAETPRAGERRVDVAGAIVAVVTLSALSVGLISLPADPASPITIAALSVAALGLVAFVAVERRVPHPMLPLRLFRRAVFLGGNLVWLLGSMTCWAAVFFVAVSLQVTVGLRPLIAGLLIVPIYIVMMVGSPLAARFADRVGARIPIVTGLAVYAASLWLLSTLGPRTDAVPRVVAGVILLGFGMATFTAPLAAVTMAALDDADQGIASGVNNAMGQLAGLLAVAVFPAVAGLAGVGFGDPRFAEGHGAALRAAAALALAGLAIAAVTIRATPVRRGTDDGSDGTGRRAVAARPS